MPAGIVPLKLPAPDIANGLADLRGLKKEIRALRAIERAAGRAARRAAATGRFVNALSGGFKAGVAGGALGGLLQGSPHVIAVKVAAAVIGRAGAAIMAQKDMPEVARLALAGERAAEAASRALLNVLAGQGARLQDFAESMAVHIRGPIDAAAARLELIAAGKIQNMRTTAGLERGGTRIQGGPQRGFTLDGGGIVTLPGSQSFTGFQNVIAEDFTGVPALEEESAFMEILARRQNERAQAAAIAGANDVIANAIFTARGAVDDAMKTAARDLNRAGARAAKPLPSRLSIGQALTPSLLATEDLNEALALDAQLIDHISANSGRNARAQLALGLAIVGVTAVVRASIAIAKAIAETAGGDWPAASAHFAAAAAYATAAVLAGTVAVGRADRDEQQAGRRRSVAREAELVLVAPGYTDTNRLRHLLIQAINADVPEHGQEVIDVGRFDKPSTLETLQGILDQRTAFGRSGSLRDRLRRHLMNDAVLGPILRSGRSLEKGVSRGVRKTKRELKRLRKKLRL